MRRRKAGWIGSCGSPLALALVLVLLGLGACSGEREAGSSGTEARSATQTPPASQPAETSPASSPTPPAAQAPAPATRDAREAEAGPQAGVAAGAPAGAVPASGAGAGEAAAEAGEPEPALPELTPPEARPAAPEIAVTDMSGRQITLADYRGKVLLAVFWATWCRPCMMEIPHLVHLQEAYGKQGLGILGLSLDRRGIAVVKPFLQSRPEINYTIVPNGLAAADAFGGITSIPTSVLIDRSGRVIRGFVGLVPGEVLEGYVKAALAEQG